MTNKILKGMTGLLLLSLVACGPGQRRSDSGEKQTLLFPQVWESPEKVIEGGTYKMGISESTAFKGLLSPVVYENSTDSYLIAPFDAPLFLTGPDFKMVDGGLATLRLDVENNSFTVKLLEGLKWDDGEPLTIDDYIFTYEIIAHKDYTGVRYDESIQLIEGIEEYHAGKADKISGIEKISDTEVRIKLKEMTPALETGGGGILTYIVPKHHLGKVAVKDLESSDQVRKNPVGAGPYKVKQVIPGESIEYEVNPYYYSEIDKPKVEKLIIKIVPSSSTLASMKAGEFDMYRNLTEDMYMEYKEFDNLAITGKPTLYYQYLGFNLGKWDDSKGENVTNTNAKLYDINLRKAIAYAMNVEQVAQTTYNGLRERANSVIPPVFEKFYNNKTRYVYDVEKANKILDEAGYKDVDGDGIRENKDGKPLEIFLAFPNMGEISEPLSQQYIQDWKAVGLKVSLTTGRIMEGNSFFDKVRQNDESLDMWMAAWSVGSSFDLNGLYGRKSAFNFTRLTSEKNDELMTKVSSLEGLKNPEYRINSIREWEENYMENELGFLPLTFRYELRPINKRVKYHINTYDQTKEIGHPTELTATEPLKSTK